jgi:hypothetical protein
MDIARMGSFSLDAEDAEENFYRLQCEDARSCPLSGNPGLQREMIPNQIPSSVII